MQPNQQNPQSPIDRIQSKRAQDAAMAAENERTQSIIDANNSTKDTLSQSMHDILMATVIGKDPRIAEVAANLTELLKSIAVATKELEDSGLGEIKETFNSLLSELSSLPDRVAATDKSDELIPYLVDVKNAIKTIEISPNVSVEAPKVDLSGVESAIREVMVTDGGVDLNDYKAHDINNADPNIQYVGFVAPNGNWYILENNTLDNSLRYKFGEKNYSRSWPKASTYNYTVLSEAVNAIKA